MEQSVEEKPGEDIETVKKGKTSRPAARRKMQKTRSFTEALREKYCTPDENVSEFIIDIVIRGKPRNNGPSTAELAHLRNIVSS